MLTFLLFFELYLPVLPFLLQVPVGCIIVHTPTDTVIAKSFNQTTVSKNATRHCEFVAVDQVLYSTSSLNSMDTSFLNVLSKSTETNADSGISTNREDNVDCNRNRDDRQFRESARKSFFADFWKQDMSQRQDIFQDCELYVTVEPCVMCAMALAYIRIGKLKS